MRVQLAELQLQRRVPFDGALRLRPALHCGSYRVLPFSKLALAMPVRARGMRKAFEDELVLQEAHLLQVPDGSRDRITARNNECVRERRQLGTQHRFKCGP